MWLCVKNASPIKISSLDKNKCDYLTRAMTLILRDLSSISLDKQHLLISNFFSLTQPPIPKATTVMAEFVHLTPRRPSHASIGSSPSRSVSTRNTAWNVPRTTTPSVAPVKRQSNNRLRRRNVWASWSRSTTSTTRAWTRISNASVSWRPKTWLSARTATADPLNSSWDVKKSNSLSVSMGKSPWTRLSLIPFLPPH